MSGRHPVAVEIERLCDRALEIAHGTPAAARIAATRERVNGPLRVAIAGRVKAGKSTLLNALVGERLAPTDAGECTHVVSWYQRGYTYDVHAHLHNGSVRDLPFRHENGVLRIELEELPQDEIDHLEVDWPSSYLSRLTLIDTPGLASLDDGASLRTRDFLAMEEGAERESDADAVIYLMRHLHRRDADFLQIFLDRAVANASPVNAVAVLSRADDVGGGRLDALASAATIARRYAADERVQALCVAVLPVAGLLAETGATLREDEAAALRALAQLEPATLGDMLLSVDRFVAPDLPEVSQVQRAELLARLGMFGVRLALDHIRSGPPATAVELARYLLELSGLDELREILGSHFAARAQALKGRSALAALRGCARDLARLNPDAAAELEREIERVEASTHAFAELRLVHQALTGALRLSDDERREIIRLTTNGTPAARAGLPPETPAWEVRNTALAGIVRWRERAANPLLDRPAADAFEIAAHSYESIYAELA